MRNPKELVDRYVALWNEPDPEARREAIRQLWARDGAHMLEPTQEARSAADALAVVPPPFEARGYEALEARVTRAYEEFVAPGEYAFRPRDNVSRLANVVKFNWEMVPTSGGDVAAIGLDVFVLDDDDKIRVDYQFIES
jgi:hypothetical protein